MNKRALLIGNNLYPKIGGLQYAENDVESVAELLYARYGFSDDETIVMTSRSAGDLFPFCQNIRKQLFNLCEMDRLDYLTIGFWGHGFLDVNGKRYLCGLDSDDKDLERTALSFEFIMGCVREIRASTTVFFLDCCRNIPARGDAHNAFSNAEKAAFSDVAGQAKAFQASFNGRARDCRLERTCETPTLAILNSCRAGQRAYEWPEQSHGAFTYFLLEALNRNPATAADCHQFISERMRTDANKGVWNGQRPEIYVEGDTARLFPVGANASVVVPPPPAVRSWHVYDRNTKSQYVLSEDELVAKFRSGQLDELTQIYSVETGWTTGKERFRDIAFGKGAIVVPPPEADQWEESRTRAAGTLKTLTIAGVEYRFRWCPAGAFMMGSSASERERVAEEFKKACNGRFIMGNLAKEILHEVELTRGFWMLETPVTQRMYSSIMRKNPSWFCKKKKPSWFCKKGGGAEQVQGFSTENFPVESVSWNDCNDFVKALNKRWELPAGQRFSLPTEAQWEYACRGGENYRYSGSNDLSDVGWYDPDSFKHWDIVDGQWKRINGYTGGRTYEVGRKQANDFGLHDMSGNVWEWCSDWYDADYYSNGPSVDPLGPSSGSNRVYRGGSWRSDASGCRCAYRDGRDPEDCGYYLGFRLLLESVQ